MHAFTQVEPQQQLQQKDESTSFVPAAELHYYKYSKFNLLMDQMLMHEQEQGSNTKLLKDQQLLAAMAAHTADQVMHAVNCIRMCWSEHAQAQNMTVLLTNKHAW